MSQEEKNEVNGEEHVEARSWSEGYLPKINEVAQAFLTDLEEERSRLSEDFPLCSLLIAEAFDKIYSTGRIPGKEFYADVLKQKPLKVIQKVFVPVKQYANFNFTGKILGPKGSSLQRLQEETQCNFAIKGRNSMRDKNKEEELRNSDDPRHGHLNKDLYVEISAFAPPAECYARMAYALAEIRKYIIPHRHDEVSQEQLLEIMEMNPELVKSNPTQYKTVLDRQVGIKGTPKYLSLLKYTSYSNREDREEPQEELEEEPRHFKRPSFYGSKYMKAQPTPSGYKRRPEPRYAEAKRFREVSTKRTVPSISMKYR